ncbi:tripartite tricarboxylate transporter TctB family protein [Rhizobacter sp. Root1221]|uniref:tripartite tricarboxylate transporter TctB family protein n=1 Tax=Rhizobacter sp. Root1221 TaxID=1736433 RepID=UPI0006F6C0F2|nr:tripartite tricarboxylate transporter TctB family protein [Rhizobacter sp. Root1221]KQV91762.1 tricarboxylate transporter [Rhizobacter sp. Root1221]
MNDKSSPTVGSRWPEAIVSAALVGAAALVIVDSLRVGNGWADDGPQSGYFPFYIGVLLLLSSGTVLVKTLLRWRGENPVFADRTQLGRVLAVLVPMTVYVGAIWLLGIYVSSFTLIGYFMRRHGKYGWPVTGLVSAAVPLVVYLVFERWFLVLLPKGPLENLLGM